MRHFIFSIPRVNRIRSRTEYYCANSYFVCVHRPIGIEILKGHFLIRGKGIKKNHFRKYFYNFTFSE